MSVAFCSDIHGNLPALKQFLTETQHVDERVFLGDIVGYCGPFPNRCISLLRDNFDYIVSGNHDRMVSQNTIDHRYLEKLPSRLEEGIQMSINQTQVGAKKYLRTIPQKQRVRIEGVETLLTHSHPTKLDEYVYSGDFPSIVGLVDTKLILMGHTHEQAIRRFDYKTVMNPGSLGAPKKSYTDGNYAILNSQGKIKLKSLTYNRQPIIEKCKQLNLSEQLIDTYR